MSRPTTTRFASSRFLRLTDGSPAGAGVDRSFQTAARAEPVRPEIDIASDVSLTYLRFVTVHLAERGGLRQQAVVEELAPLRLAQLGGEQGAHVDGAVELDVADDIPRNALVDGDVALLVGSDEVRAPQAPDSERAGEQGQEHESRQHDPAPDRMALPSRLGVRRLAVLGDGNRRNPVELIERVLVVGAVLLRRR